MKRMLAWTLAITLIIGLLPITQIEAQAYNYLDFTPRTISYVDESGTTHTVQAYPLSAYIAVNSSASWQGDDVFPVNSTITLPNYPIYVDRSMNLRSYFDSPGNATAMLILMDDTTLNIIPISGTSPRPGMTVNGTLNIYGQSNNTGKLISRGGNRGGEAIYVPGILNINSGYIEAWGYRRMQSTYDNITSSGIGRINQLNIRGGTVVAHGSTDYGTNNDGAGINPRAGGKVVISGGNITVNGGSGSAGIGAAGAPAGSIYITGGTVNASPGSGWAAGIGGSYSFHVEGIYITGGTITGNSLIGGNFNSRENSPCEVFIGPDAEINGTNRPLYGKILYLNKALVENSNSLTIQTYDYKPDAKFYADFSNAGNEIKTILTKAGLNPANIYLGSSTQAGTVGNTGNTLDIQYRNSVDSSGMISFNVNNTDYFAAAKLMTEIRTGDITLYTKFSGGSGTAASPYIISVPEQLLNFASEVNSGQSGGANIYYNLGADIDLSAYPNRTPIGTSANPFRGVFDGKGYAISNLAVNASSTADVGLFGFVSGGTIRNLAVIGGSVTGGNNTGGIIGRLNGGSLSNSYAANTVSGSGNTGGLVGNMQSGAIENCAALNPKVSGSGRVAGVNTGTLTNNIAYSGMLNSSGTAVWNHIGAAQIDGASITREEIWADGSIGGRFTTGWATANGKLPGAGSPRPLPDYLRTAGTFQNHAAVNTTYTTALTLADITLAPNYAWVNPTERITSAGDGQVFSAYYTHPGGTHNPVAGDITVNVAKAAGYFGPNTVINAVLQPGMKLSDISLPNGYVWNNPDTPLYLGIGISFPAAYTDPSGNYTAANGFITLNITDSAGVPYIDEDGILKGLESGYTPMTNGGATTLTDGWYVVNNDVVRTGRITVSGHVRIILGEGCHLNAAEGISVSGGNKVSIFAQSTGTTMGKLTAHNTNATGEAGIGSERGSCGDIVIAGGEINASARMGAGIGGGTGNAGNIIIFGGKVTATGGGESAGIGGGWNSGAGGNIYIYGGEVTATGGSVAPWGGAGIGGGGRGSGAGGNVFIGNATVTAVGGSNASGIGGGNGGAAGTFTMLPDCGVIYASSVADMKSDNKKGGILYIGNTVRIYGTLKKDFTVENHQTLDVPDGAVLTVPIGVTLTNNGTAVPSNGSVVNIQGTFAGNKMNGANVSIPIVNSRSGTSLTLNTAALRAATGQDVEYAISSSNTITGIIGSWQDGTTFNGLTVNTSYWIFARSKENAIFKAGAMSSAAVFTGLNPGAAVEAPELVSKTPHIITVFTEAAENGQTVEYGINTVNTPPSTLWQDSGTFSGLERSTVYYVFARSKANSVYSAGASEVTQIATLDDLDISYMTDGESDTFWSFNNNILTVKDGADVKIIGKVANGRRIEIEANATVRVMLSDVSIAGLAANQSPLLLNNNSNLTLILDGVNVLEAGENRAGLQAASDSAVIIDGDGELTAIGGNGGGAGIGGGRDNINAGNITVNGGIITAKGSNDDVITSGGAGIGGAAGGTGGTITINGGHITANAGNHGAGIGGGGAGAGENITINGGAVNAKGENYGAGIGGGRGASGGSVMINGGTVTANGADGIGAGYPGSSCSFTMNGNAVVFANSISDTSAKTRGILFVGSNNALFYGTSVIPSDDFTIPIGRTLTVPSGAMFTISDEVTLTNNGTVIPADGSTVNISGTLSGSRINGVNISAPTIESSTVTGITLNTVTLLAATGQSAEYAISSSSNISDIIGNWQSDPVFNGLEGNKTYWLFARSEKNDSFNAGTAKSIQFTTTKNAGASVTAPTVVSKTWNSIIMISDSPSNGQAPEYAINTTNAVPNTLWQDDGVFTGLNEYTQYYVFARAKENATYNTGAASAGTAVRTGVTTPSSATLQFRNNGFNPFQNTVNYQLFYRSPVDIAIKAADPFSGVAEVAYYKSPISLGSPNSVNLSGVAWIPGTGDSISFNVTDAESFILYVRITDNDGNESYYCDGVTVYAKPEREVSANFDASSADNVYVSVDMNGYAVNGITLNGNALNPSDYEIGFNEIIFKSSYLSTLNFGTHNFIVRYDMPGFVNAGNNEPPETTVKIAVRAAIDLSNITGDGGSVWNFDGNVLYVNDGADVEITGTVTNGRRIVVSGTARIKINNLSVSGLASSQSPLLLNSGANLTLYIAGKNNLSAGTNRAGIHAPNGTNLVIEGDGDLIANGGSNGAGIGGGYNNAGGSIIINGGVIEANGGQNGAGIGGGEDSGSGVITINGGTVTANGGVLTVNIPAGSGIGCGRGGTGGSITINGGTVNSLGGQASAGIGGTNVEIIISGGKITASTVLVTGNTGACIGGTNAVITITGGIITASGVESVAGIGGNGSKTAINGGYITASGVNGAGIGGNAANPGTFTMDGNAVVYASSVRDTSAKANGILFVGNSGTVYGGVSLADDLAITAGRTLIVIDTAILTIPQGVTLTNSGTLTNNGKIINNGTVIGFDICLVCNTHPCECPPPTNHAITVTNDGNGTANANTVSATQGATITLTATPNGGYQFKEWQVISGGISLSSMTTATATFTMPDNAVEVKAVFEIIPIPTFSVSFNVINGNGSLTATVDGTGISSDALVQQGKTIIFTATPNTGYRVKEWKLNGSTVNGTNESYTISNITAAHNVTVEFELIPVTTYAVTVTNGTGGGNYAAGVSVIITANTTPSGQQFKEWDITPAVTFIAGTSKNSPTTEFTMPSQAVTATAVYEPLPPTNHAITVTNDGNGIANANVVSAAQGATIMLTANPNSGYQFKEWQVVSGAAIVLSNAMTNPATFTMPNNAVEVRATFEIIPIPMYAISFKVINGNGTLTAMADGTGISSDALVQQGKTIIFTAMPNTGYRVREWKLNGSIVNGTNTSYTGSNITAAQTVTVEFELIPVTTHTVTFNLNGGTRTGGGDIVQTVVSGGSATAPAVSRSNYSFDGWDISFSHVIADITVTARWRYNGGNGGWTASPTSPPTTPTNPPTAMPEPTQPPANMVTGTVNGTAANFTKNENGSVSLVLTAEDIAKYPVKNDTFTVEISNQTVVNVSFPISAMITANASRVEIKIDSGTVILTKAVIEAYRTTHGNTFEISIRAGSFIVEMLKNGRAISYNDSANPLFIRIPTKLAADTNSLGYVAVRKTTTGNTIMPYSVYKNGEVTFQSPTTGTFDVIYNGKTYSDIGGHWALDNINFVSARTLFNGTGGDTFSPEMSMNRAMFVQVLANIEGVDLSVYKTSRFADVTLDKWYAAAVEWAAEKGIVSGVGGGRFDPEASITREQMAVMLMNYVIHKGYELPTATTSAFNDEASIAEWAFDAVKRVQAAGIVSGKPGNIYDPKNIATRAEVATIFANYVEACV